MKQFVVVGLVEVTEHQQSVVSLRVSAACSISGVEVQVWRRWKVEGGGTPPSLRSALNLPRTTTMRKDSKEKRLR